MENLSYLNFKLIKLRSMQYEAVRYIIWKYSVNKNTESWSMYHIPGRVHVICIKIIYDIKYWMRLN